VPLLDGDKVSGALTPFLTLSNVLGGDAGVYTAVVSNAHGCVTSVVAQLTVIDPLITDHPFDQVRQLATIPPSPSRRRARP